jgi:hypothetical protein
MGALCPGSTWAKPLYSKRASYPTGRAVRPPTAARSRPRPAGRVLDASPDESRGIALGYATEASQVVFEHPRADLGAGGGQDIEDGQPSRVERRPQAFT